MAITKATASSIAPAAKGDLVVGSATNDAAVLGVGSNDQVLTADSSTATGLKWATPSSTASFKGCSLYQSTDISLANDTTIALTWNSENFDTDGFHSTSTNTGRITIPSGLGGYYHINGAISFVGGAAGFRRVDIFKNGSIWFYGGNIASASASGGTQLIPFSTIGNFVAGDYLSISVSQASGGTISTLGGASFGAFNVTYLGV